MVTDIGAATLPQERAAAIDATQEVFPVLHDRLAGRPVTRPTSTARACSLLHHEALSIMLTGSPWRLSPRFIEEIFGANARPAATRIRGYFW